MLLAVWWNGWALTALKHEELFSRITSTAFQRACLIYQSSFFQGGAIAEVLRRQDESLSEWRETQEKRLQIDQQKADFNSALFRITALAVLAVCIAARILLQRSRALDRGRCS